MAIRAVLLALVLLTMPAAAQAAPVTGEASYVVNVAGINVASVAVTLSDDGGSFAIALDGTISGLGTAIARGTVRGRVEGRSAAARLTPAQFSLETRSGAAAQMTSVGFAGGSAAAFMVEPPLPSLPDRVAIERRHLADVTDPISPFVLHGAALDASLCERTNRIFTGIERFDVVMAFAALQQATSPRTGYRGPVVLCTARYVPISGHFTTSELTAALAQAERILVWYAPLGSSGYFVPYRLLMTTAFGELSVVLTRLSGNFSG